MISFLVKKQKAFLAESPIKISRYDLDLYLSYIESLRLVVSIGRLVVSGTADEGADIVSVAAGDDIVESEPVVFALLAQLVKAMVADAKAAQTAAVLNN